MLSEQDRLDSMNVQLFGFEPKLTGRQLEEIKELCKSFWVSERGKEIIRKTREVSALLRKEGEVNEHDKI